MTVPAPIIDTVSTILINISVTFGLNILNKPTVSMDIVTIPIIGYPYCIPYPLKEFHLPIKVASISIKVAAMMSTNPPY